MHYLCKHSLHSAHNISRIDWLYLHVKIETRWSYWHEITKYEMSLERTFRWLDLSRFISSHLFGKGCFIPPLANIFALHIHITAYKASCLHIFITAWSSTWHCPLFAVKNVRVSYFSAFETLLRSTVFITMISTVISHTCSKNCALGMG